MGAEVATKISAFRAFRSELRAGFAAASGPTVNIDVLLTWSTTRFVAIEVRFDQRAAGVSTYTFVRLVRHAFNMLTGFSTRPLRLASFVGFAFTMFGIAILAYVLVRYLQSHGVVPGFAFLASIIAIFSGAQLFTIGIIGEYLARMHHRLLEKPSYVIREATAHDAGVDAH
jgi:undecaprenyl-phosphate 4-deoxy-4-formamido-L-arabinose transferase